MFLLYREDILYTQSIWNKDVLNLLEHGDTFIRMMQADMDGPGRPNGTGNGDNGPGPGRIGPSPCPLPGRRAACTTPWIAKAANGGSRFELNLRTSPVRFGIYPSLLSASTPHSYQHIPLTPISVYPSLLSATYHSLLLASTPHSYQRIPLTPISI